MSRTQRRLLLADAVRRSGLWLSVSAAAALLLTLADRFLNLGAPVWLIALLALSGLPIACVVAGRRRAASLEAAIILDGDLGLKDRLGTAISLESLTSADHDNPMRRWVEQDAQSLASRLDPRAVARIEWPLSWGAAALGAVACALLLWLVEPRNVLAGPGPTAEQLASRDARQKAAEALRERADHLRGRTADDPLALSDANATAREQALNTFDRLARQLDAPVEAESSESRSGASGDRDAEIASAAREAMELADRLDRQSQIAEQARQRASERLAGLPEPVDPGAADEFTDALRQGDMAAAAKWLDELDQRLKDAPPEQREALAESLRQSAEQISESAQQERIDPAGESPEQTLEDLGLPPEQIEQWKQDPPSVDEIRRELQNQGRDPIDAQQLAEQAQRELAEQAAEQRAREQLEETARRLSDLADSVENPPPPADRSQGNEAGPRPDPGENADSPQPPPGREGENESRPAGEEPKQGDPNNPSTEQGNRPPTQEGQSQPGQSPPTSEKTDPEEQAESGQPAESGEPPEPGKSTLPGEKTQPAEKTKPGEKTEPGEKTQPGEKTKPGEKTQPGEQEPSETGEPGESPQPTPGTQPGELPQPKPTETGPGETTPTPEEEIEPDGKPRPEPSGTGEPQPAGEPRPGEEGQPAAGDGAAGQPQPGQGRSQPQGQPPGGPGSRVDPALTPGSQGGPDELAPSTGSGTGEQPGSVADRVKHLRDALERIDEAPGTGPSDQEISQEMKDAARELLEQMSPEERQELERWAAEKARQNGDGLGSTADGSPKSLLERTLPTRAVQNPRLFDYDTQDMDLSKPDRPVNDRVIAEMFGPDHERPEGAIDRQPMDSAPMREAAQAIERALNEEAIPPRYRELIRNWARRLPRPDAPPSSGTSPDQ
ncbi:MAG: hypothetical protein IT430_15730 [Phycisphaerales bacterium]|nr:hypothetical protein [Phycisphaerales bacterium]